MKKGKVFAVAGVTLLQQDCWLHVQDQIQANQVLLQTKTRTMAMSTRQIQQLWTIRYPLKLLHMTSLQMW